MIDENGALSLNLNTSGSGTNGVGDVPISRSGNGGGGPTPPLAFPVFLFSRTVTGGGTVSYYNDVNPLTGNIDRFNVALPDNIRP